MMAPLMVFIVVWFLIYALHRFVFSPLPSSTSANEDSPASSHSLSITPYFIASYSTCSFNSFIHRISFSFRSFLLRWFLPGPVVAFIGLLLALCILLYNLLSLASLYLLPLLASSPASSLPLSESNVLSIAVPGVTVPLSSLPFLSLSVLLAVVCHEAGHALCAEASGHRVKRVGIFWCVFFPGAWVEVEEEDEEEEEEDEETMNTQERLMIVTAGVWHNLLLAGIGIAVLLLLPFLLSPFYAKAGEGNPLGATLLAIDETISPALAASPHLHSGDRLTSINDQPIASVIEWRNTLMDMYSSPLSHHDGRCISAAALHDTLRVHHTQLQRLEKTKGSRSWQQLNTDITLAMQTQHERAPLRPAQDEPRHAAARRWEQLRIDDDPGVVDRTLRTADAEFDHDMLAFACCIPEVAHHSPLTCFNFSSRPSSPQSVCVRAKGLIDSTTLLCNNDQHCVRDSRKSDQSNDDDMLCAKPQLFDPSFRLIVLGRTAVSPLSSPLASSHQSVLFTGSIAELLLAVDCTDYAPRPWVRLLTSPFSLLFECLVRLPVVVMRLMQFTVAVSCSLFVLNCLPIPMSDGQQALQLWAEMVEERQDKKGRGNWMQRLLALVPRWIWEEKCVRWIGHFSTGLFVLNVSLTLAPAVWTISSLL